MKQQTILGVVLFSVIVVAVIFWVYRGPSDALPQTGQWWAIEGATLYTMKDEKPLKNGVLLFRGDTIMKVGAKVKLPKDTKVIQAYGRFLTPGLVIPNTRLGLVEISLERSTRNDSMPSRKAVRAAFRVVDGFNHNSSLIPIARIEGVTSVVSRPYGGLISGQSALFDLWGHPQQMTVRAPLAVHASIPTGRSAFAWLKLRQAMEAARFFQTYQSQYTRRKVRKLPFSRLDLLALLRVVTKEVPLVLDVNRAADILTAIRFASTQDIKLILSGVREGWQVAEQLARAKIPVLLGPPFNLPSSFATLGSRYDNAALLHKAGVLIAFASQGGSHNIRSIRHEAGIAVAWGLPHGAALQALTRNFYQMVGLGKTYGTLRRGSKANLVLWSGDPVELSTRAIQVWIRGQSIPMVSRQTQLRDRYRDLKNLFRQP